MARSGAMPVPPAMKTNRRSTGDGGKVKRAERSLDVDQPRRRCKRKMRPGHPLGVHADEQFQTPVVLPAFFWGVASEYGRRRCRRADEHGLSGKVVEPTYRQGRFARYTRAVWPAGPRGSPSVSSTGAIMLTHGLAPRPWRAAAVVAPASGCTRDCRRGARVAAGWLEFAAATGRGGPGWC